MAKKSPQRGTRIDINFTPSVATIEVTRFVKMNRLELYILLCLILRAVFGDDEYAAVERPKRFFQNLNSYFSKSAEPTVEIPKVNVTRVLKPVYVFDNDYLCSIGSNECRSQQDIGGRVETSTPVTYLTPPFKVPDPLPKFGDQPVDGFNGYVYPNGDYDRRNQFNFQNSEPFKVSVFGKIKLGFILKNICAELRGKAGRELCYKDVLCVKSSKNGKFVIGLTTSRSLQTTPIIENTSSYYRVENPPRCSVATINSTCFQITIHEPDLVNCGVYYCNSDTDNNLMCMNLRFPLVPGIKTSDDVSVRIQCHPQQQLLSHVKQLQLKPSHLNSNLGRSLPLISTVSNTNAFQELHTDVNLYALSSAGYTHLIRNNDVVTLGEELQLRGVVRQGDGWQYSRFGRIIVQRVLAPSSGYVYGENNDAVVVVADDGCVNSAMKIICPNAPFNDPVNPLVSMVNMKMFVFNNMKDGDELTMTITMFGCVHYEDCFIENSCPNWSKENHRVKRSSQQETNNTIDSTSEITIKIKTTPNSKRVLKCDENVCEEIIYEENRSSRFFIVLGCCFSGVVIGLVYHYYCIKSLTR